MSIRSHEAVAHASRFSLRSALIGEGPSTTPTRTAAAPTFALDTHKFQPILTLPFQSAPPSQSTGNLSFSFSNNTQNHDIQSRIKNSQLDSSPNQKQQQPQQQQQQPVMSIFATTALARIRDAQAKQQHQQPTVQTTSNHSVSGAQSMKLLPSGYVSGGIAGNGSNSEILRLTGVLESVNHKMNSYASKLEKTDLSLRRANEQIKSERSASRAALANVSDALRVLTVTEQNSRATSLLIQKEKEKVDVELKKSKQRQHELEEFASSAQSKLQRISEEHCSINALLQHSELTLKETQTLHKALQDERDAAITELKMVQDQSNGDEKIQFQAQLAEALEAQKLHEQEWQTKWDSYSSTIEDEKARISTDFSSKIDVLTDEKLHIKNSLDSLSLQRDALINELESTKVALAKQESEPPQSLDSLSLQRDALINELESTKVALAKQESEPPQSLDSLSLQRDALINELESTKVALAKHESEPPQVISGGIQTGDEEMQRQVQRSRQMVENVQDKLNDSERRRLALAQHIQNLESGCSSKRLFGLEQSTARQASETAGPTAYMASHSTVRSFMKSAEKQIGADNLVDVASRSHSKTSDIVLHRRKDPHKYPFKGLPRTASTNVNSTLSRTIDTSGYSALRWPLSNLLNIPFATTPPPTSSDASQDNHTEVIKNLVVAVSRDVIYALVNSRRDYMSASGFDENEIADALKAFEPSSTGDDDSKK